MTGILLLFVAGIWLGIVIFLTKAIAKKLPEKWWKVPLSILLFLALLPLPLMDEIVGGRQFANLCKENATIQVDREKARGRTVYLNSLPQLVVRGTWIPVKEQLWQFVDATTKEPILSYKSFHASGGMLIRMLGISEGGMPLTFKGFCEPQNSPASAPAFKEFGINYIEPPIANNGEKK
ncbi:MAG: hypothetical protein HYS18_06990 [Burkholderiales bacterium]|nr:hypothetical protein [Burkholderiales bacterium]